MPQCNRSPIYIQLSIGNVQLSLNGNGLSCKGFICFDQINFVDSHIHLFQKLSRTLNRSNSHNCRINSPKSGLMVLHGEPGTGKTSYIRNLIYRTKKRFMFFDKSLFHHMSDSSLIDMLLEHRDSIIVLEDCEDLLTDRTGLGSCMTTILNLTDGIIGDSMKFKFICTFNADVMDIDPAILRKGRMHLKYEFKKLDADKVVALGKALGVDAPHEEMPLCDVYNFAVDNGKPQEKSKVGF